MLKTNQSRYNLDHAEVVRTAERLQLADGASLANGVEPVYLNEAVRQLRREQAADSKAYVLLALIPLLMVAQCLSLFSAISGSLRDWDGLQFWLLVGLCLSIGSVLARTQRTRNKACLIVIGTTFSAFVLCGIFAFVMNVIPQEGWLRYLVNITGLQMGATIAGTALGSFLDKFIRKATELD